MKPSKMHYPTWPKILLYMTLVTIPTLFGSTYKLEIQDKERLSQVALGSDVEIKCIAEIQRDSGNEQAKAFVSFNTHFLGSSSNQTGRTQMTTMKTSPMSSVLTIKRVTAKQQGYYVCRGKFPLNNNNNNTYGSLHDVVYVHVENPNDAHFNWNQILKDYPHFGDQSIELKVTVVGHTECVQMDNCSAMKNYPLKESFWQSKVMYGDNILYLADNGELTGLYLEMTAFNKTSNFQTTLQLNRMESKEALSATILSPKQVRVHEEFTAECRVHNSQVEDKTLSFWFTRNTTGKVCEGETAPAQSIMAHNYTFKVMTSNPFSITSKIKSDLRGRIQCQLNDKPLYSKDICVNNYDKFSVLDTYVEVKVNQTFELKCSAPTCSGELGNTNVRWVRNGIPGPHRHVHEECAYTNSATLVKTAVNESGGEYVCERMPEKNAVNEKPKNIKVNVTVIWEPTKATTLAKPIAEAQTGNRMVILGSIIGVALFLCLVMLIVYVLRARKG